MGWSSPVLFGSLIDHGSDFFAAEGSWAVRRCGGQFPRRICEEMWHILGKIAGKYDAGFYAVLSTWCQNDLPMNPVQTAQVCLMDHSPDTCRGKCHKSICILVVLACLVIMHNPKSWVAQSRSRDASSVRLDGFFCFNLVTPNDM